LIKATSSGLVELQYKTSQKEDAMSEERSQGRIISIDEGLVKSQLGNVVRETIEQTLNKMLDAEADELCGAKRYARSPDRIDTRAGHYERTLDTKAVRVKLKVPKLRTIPFESAIIDRYRRRESSVEEALMEMYLAGVSVRRVEDITEALWGTRVSAGVVSKLNQELYDKIDLWRTRLSKAVPVRVPRWHRAQAHLGRRDTKCIDHSRLRRKCRWLQGNPRRRRRG
jgi:hypothetical protein